MENTIALLEKSHILCCRERFVINDFTTNFSKPNLSLQSTSLIQERLIRVDVVSLLRLDCQTLIDF